MPDALHASGDALYLHGSSANASFVAADGAEVCVTVTHLDGLVLARSVFSHSVNYRSAMVLGTATIVRDDEERMDALRVIVEHLVPGQWAAARHPTAREMAAAWVSRCRWPRPAVKVREGGPADGPNNQTLDVWAGVLPAAVTFGSPEPDPDLRPGITIPGHVGDSPQPGQRGNQRDRIGHET